MTAVDYSAFLASKAKRFQGDGFPAGDVNPVLHPWQAQIVRWAAGKGRAAIWADTGLGKTFMQIEWARAAAARRDGRVLIVAPLAVCHQTVREAAKLDVDLQYLRADDYGPGPVITNYEMVHRFDARDFDAVVLDESSILKDVTAKTRDLLIAQFRDIRWRLACTATPAPNDIAELCNHAEFLGAASRREMLSTYFIHDQDGWRAKHHARAPMFRWMSTWAVAIRRPSDLGYPDGGYALPPLSIVPEIVAADVPAPDGQLFAVELGGVGGRAKVRRSTLAARCERAAALVDAEPEESWLLWCGLNDEADALARLIPGAVNVHGGMTPEEKAELLLAFADGEVTRLVTKPSIAAFGLNWQHCARVAFVGLSDSYEAYYQAIRRCWRYGQTRPVNVHIVLSELESQIAANVARKEDQARRFTGGLVDAMRQGAEWNAA